jgi:tetratricopeptide (TPR) repeat protein
MNPWQARWSIVAALVCLSALAAQRVRGEEASGGAPAPATRVAPGSALAPGVPSPPAVAAVPAAGPLRLTRPLAPETLARVLAEAEALYRARQHEQSRQAFATLVEIEPALAHAWLRLGNLHQLAGRDAEALEAYRAASLAVPASRAEAETRGKALLNIALLHVAAASRSIDELDAMRLGALDDARSDVARQVGAQRHRAVRAAGRDLDAPPRPAEDAATAAPAAQPAGPWTVDRWTGRARRAPARRDAPGRGAVVEPLLEPLQEVAPAPSRPVEVLRGGAPPPRP